MIWKLRHLVLVKSPKMKLKTMHKQIYIERVSDVTPPERETAEDKINSSWIQSEGFVSFELFLKVW